MTQQDDELWARVQARLKEADPAATGAPPRTRKRAFLFGSLAGGVALVAVGAAGGAVTVASVTPDSLTSVTSNVAAAPNVPASPSAVSRMADAETAIYPYWGGGNVFRVADGLADEAGSAPGYRFTTDGVNLRAAARVVADQLGIRSDIKQSGDGWVAGKDDGTGPSLWVSGDSIAGWSYSDASRNPWGCTDTRGAAASGSNAEVMPEPTVCEPESQPISRDEAQKRAAAFLQAVGVSDNEVDWEVGGDDFTTFVTAWQLVEGQRTQLSWSFTFDNEDIVYASGHFAAPEKIGPFPTVGAATAVNRSQQVKWMPFGPTAVMDPTMVYPADSSVSSLPEVEGAQPAAATEGKVTINYSPITVTGAEPTVTQYWQPDGTLLLLPAYTLTTKDQGVWVVIAVADSAVTFAEAVSPVAVPMAEARNQAQADTFPNTLNP